MIAVLQRVSQGSVSVDNTLISSISHGLVIFLGVMDNDEKNDCELLSKKIANLRIFNDNNNKMNHSIKDVEGSTLVISQFTLCGDWRKGRRPSFIHAAPPEKGEQLFYYFMDNLKLRGGPVEAGEFGSMMDINLINEGPVTFVLDSKMI